MGRIPWRSQGDSQYELGLMSQLPASVSLCKVSQAPFPSPPRAAASDGGSPSLHEGTVGSG